MRRAGRPGLIGLAARTAVVTGTANAMNAKAADRQQASAQAAFEQQQFQAAQQQAQVDAAAAAAVAAQTAAAAAAAPVAPAAPPAAAAPAPAPAPAVDIVAELQKLGALKDAGLLDDAEFAAAKARLLA
ncbi:SHOCT domain-containing protein [Microbacterium aurum]